MKRLTLMLLWLVVCASGASAQDENMIRPISRAHVREYARLLDLDDEQVQVVEMLHEGYMQAIQRENARMREMMEEATKAWNPESGEEFDQAALMEAQETMAEASINHIRTNLELQDQFFADMKAMLGAGQAEDFPRIERMRRRQMLLQEMDIAWAQVDLVACLQELKLSSESGEEFDETVIRYEIAMDRELSQVFAFLLEMIDRGPEIMMGQDEDEMMEMMEKFFGWVHAMRAINKEHARKLGSLLSGPDRERFEDEARRRAFPRVYAESDAARAIGVARRFADLSDEQGERIEELRVRHAAQLAAANQRWASAIDEEAEDMDFESMMMEFMDGGESESAKAERARDELDERFRKRLEAILTPEQIERLPMSRRDEQRRIEEEFRKQMELQAELEEAGEIVIDGGG